MDVMTDRRAALRWSAAAAVAPLLPTAALAQEAARPLLTARPRPVVDARFPAEIAPGVFMIPDKRIPLVPNIGIVVGKERVLVVDCGLGIESAEQVLDVTRRLAPGRKIVLTVTHAHPEHGFGAQVFRRDAQIYYNALQRDYLRRAGQGLLAGFRSGVLPPAHRDILDGVELIPPHAVYSTPTTTLDLGGRTVQLHTWGTAHTPGDQVVLLPDERILFTGDLIEERMFPIVPLFPPMIRRDDIDVDRWEAVLRQFVDWNPRIIVPGHGNLGETEVPKQVLEYFRFVRAAARQRDPGAAKIHDAVRARYATWENPEFIDPAIAYFQG